MRGWVRPLIVDPFSGPSTRCYSAHSTPRGHNGGGDERFRDDRDDPHLWLEDVTGDDALDWVRRHNEPTLAELGGERFEQMRAEALEILDTDARIPYVRRRGEYLYNFWRDADNPRGLWRRTTLDSTAPTTPTGTCSSTSTRWPPPTARTGCGRAPRSSSPTTRWP